ncbi:MAG TPA: NADH-quinone oxidoreductase subunit H [Balneolaceae bacterium]|nr:NADH-quinone oxidoreductase subunit H [Balneolaceae bacterium]
MKYLYIIVEILFVLCFSPLIAGIQAKMEERLQSQQGPSIFQPYFDLIKLFRKESLVPKVSSPLFRFAPYMVFMFYLFLSIILPIITAFPLPIASTADLIGGALFFSAASAIKTFAAIDSRSNYAHLGASRGSSFSVFAEPILLVIFIMLGVVSSTNNPFVVNNVLRSSPGWYYSLLHGFITVAFFILLIFETGQLPVESHSHGELGMVDQALPFEYTGPDLAMYKWGGYMKSFIFMSIFLNVFLVPFWVPGKHAGLAIILLYLLIHLAKLTVLVFIFALINNTISKFKLYKNFDFLAIAFALTFLATLSYYVINY